MSSTARHTARSDFLRAATVRREAEQPVITADAPPTETSGRPRPGVRANLAGGSLATAVPFAYLLLHTGSGALAPETTDFIAESLARPLSPAAWFARLCTFVPIGSLSARLTLAAAFGVAALTAALYRAINSLLRAQGVARSAQRTAIGVAGCWLAAGASVVFEQGLVPGARAFSAALVLLLLTELQRAAFGRRIRPFAWLCAGLLLAQDALTFALILPAAVSCWRASHGMRWRIHPAFGASALLGAPAWIARQTPPEIGARWAGSGFWFDASTASTGFSSFDTLVTLASKYPAFAACAVLGGIALLQTRTTSPATSSARKPRRVTANALRVAGRTWSLALLMLLVVGPSCANLLALASGIDPASTAGLLTICLPLCTLLAAALLGALLSPDTAPLTAASTRTLAAATCICALGLFELHTTAVARDTSSDDLADAWTAATIDRFPARTLYLLSDAQLTSLARAAEAEQRTRPDLRLLAVSQLRHWSSAAALAKEPGLRPLVRNYLLFGALSRAELESLRASRPVFLDLTAPSELHPALRPAQFALEVVGSRAGKIEQRDAAHDYELDLEALARTAEHAAISNEGRAFLARLDLEAARYFANLRDDRHASAARERGRLRAPAWQAWDHAASPPHAP